MNNKSFISSFMTLLFVLLASSLAAAQTGTLQVTLTLPPEAGAVQGQWRVDNGSWQNSGAQAAGLTVGNHTVDFKTLFGLIAPAPETVNITASAMVTIAETYTLEPANTYFVANGFDTNNDGQPDWINTGKTTLLAIQVAGQTDTYLQSSIGGMTSPLAYYPDVTRQLTTAGNKASIGSGSFSSPQLGSALQFRTILYSTTGTNALKAWYENAISAFLPQLLPLLQAEEDYRTALRVDPFYEDALNGLLEVYYGRAEGFMLIGNDYMAKAYKHKFDRALGEQTSITDLEIADFKSALLAYETGFSEFMKLFNPDFVGLNETRKPYLDIDPENLFFTRRFQNPDNPVGQLVCYEALRGQTNAIGAASAAADGSGNVIGPVQGSPDFQQDVIELKALGASEQKSLDVRKDMSAKALSRQVSQWNAVDAPVKINIPVPIGAPTWQAGDPFTIRFDASIDSQYPIQSLDLLIEFDNERLTAPTDGASLDFSGCSFTSKTSFSGPGTVYGENQLFANQLMIHVEATAPLSGTKSIVKIPFLIKKGESGTFHVYAAGSGGTVHSGYKDIAILYKLAAAHANAVAEKVRRQYNVGDSSSVENCIAAIQNEVQEIGGWFDHIQGLLAKCATQAELAPLDALQTQINSVSGAINGLGALRDFIRSGANVFGYPDDYIPFYNAADKDTFSAIRTLVIGGDTFSPNSAGGYYGWARQDETTAVSTYKYLDDTKDKIRNDIFTINEDAENRLAQICGRIDSNGNPSLSVNDDIDYDLLAAPRNAACEVGQNVLLLQRAQQELAKDTADIDAQMKDIELEKKYLQDAIAVDEKKQQLMLEYGDMQGNLDTEIGNISAQQTRLKAMADAAATIAEGGGLMGFIDGEKWGALIAQGVQLANGMAQADLEERKGELQAEKDKLSAREQAQLTGLDTELFKLQGTKTIEQMINALEVKNITAQIAQTDIAIAMGNLNKIICERDEALAKRGRALANLGEMSFVDPTFRLTQYNSMKQAETSLEFLKRWLYLWTRSLFYKWAVPDNFIIHDSANLLPDVGIDTIQRIQIVGALDQGISEKVLTDTISATDYVKALMAFDQKGPMSQNLSPVTINRVNSNNTARYSLREDFLKIVRTADTQAENDRVKQAFVAWLKSPERLDADGNMVIDFDTLWHLDGYNNPVTSTNGTWTNFALRSYSSKPLWDHKITQVGVSLKASGGAFTSRNTSVSGSIEYGGTGYMKGDTASSSDFRAYRMNQWKDSGNGSLEPIDFRTVPVTIPSSLRFEDLESTYLVSDLKERPVVATHWKLVILKDQIPKIQLDNIEDIYIYIYSEAYQEQ